MAIATDHGVWRRYERDPETLPQELREITRNVAFFRRDDDGADFYDIRVFLLDDATLSVAAEPDSYGNYRIAFAAMKGAPALVDGLHLMVIEGWNGSDVDLVRGHYIDGQTLEVLPIAETTVIPDKVSRRQFFLQLAISELTDAVAAWVETQPALVQIAYRESATFERADPMLQSGFNGLGFSTAQVDAFFGAAAAL